MPSYLTNVCLFTIISYFYRKVNSLLSFSYHHLPYFVFTYCVFLLNFYRNTSYKTIVFFTKIRYDIQVEQPQDLARDSGQRKLTYSLQNHCASSRSVYLSRRLDAHCEKFAIAHHLKEGGVFTTEINN